MKNRGMWLAAAIGVLLDQVTKRWAVERLMPGPEIRLWPGVFHLTYAENRGAAWSLFQESGEFLRWISLAVALGLIAFGLFGSRQNRWEQAGYGCILAGAIGNGIDRFQLGYVIDFLNFTLINFPVFNVADVAINIGVGCLIVNYLLDPDRALEPKKPWFERKGPRP